MTTDDLRALLWRCVQWPHRSGNNLVPWWLIAWRALWLPLGVVALVMLYAATVAAYGPRKAADVLFIVLLILGIIVLNVSDEKIIEIPAAILAIIGGVLVVLGVLVWIWRVMP